MTDRLLLGAGSVAAACVLWLASGTITACSALAVAGDAGQNDRDAAKQQPDAAIVNQGAPRFVVVNGLVDGGAKALNDVRLCFSDRPDDYPVPDDPAQPMPLSSYPGIARGRGLDLGPISTTATSVQVFDAKSIKADVKGGDAQFRQTCGQLAGDPSSYVELTQPEAPGPHNLLVLQDDAGQSSGVSLRLGQLTTQAVAPADDAGATGALYGTFSVYAAWGEGGTFDVSMIPGDAGTVSLSSALGSAAPSTVAPIPITSPYDQTSLRFESSEPAVTPRTLEQTLAETQILSDPTTAPSELYGRRADFAFVVVGDPASSAIGDAGADPSFDGKAMHILVVPFYP